MDASIKRALPWLAAVAFFMQTLDATILNTALPSMARDLHESPLQMQSVVVSYMLTVALLIPASGWLADRYGTRSVFSTAIGLFSLGSLLCALSPSIDALVAARIVQGIGGALLLPVGRLAILRVFPRAELLKTLAFVTVPGLIGPLVGPPLGGWLVEVASWHWVFLINIPVGVLGVIATRKYMPELKGAEQRFDVVGFVMFSIGMTLVSLALQGLGERALSPAVSLLMLVGGLGAMAAYWFHAPRTSHPLFSVNLFRIPTFSIGIVGNLFSRLGSGAMPFLMPLFLQLALGYAPSAAGLSMVPIVLGAMLAKSFAVKLIDRYDYQRVLVVNTLLLGMLIASFSLLSRAVPQWLILVQLGVFGIVNSLQFTAMNTLTLNDLDPSTASSGNSLLSVVMQLSMSLGVAAAASLLQAFGGVGASGDGMVRAFHMTFLSVGVLSAVAALIFFQLGRHEHPQGTPTVVEEG